MLASLESKKKTATTTKGCPTLSLALKSRVCGVASIPLTGVNIDETGCWDVRKGTQLHEKKNKKTKPFIFPVLSCVVTTKAVYASSHRLDKRQGKSTGWVSTGTSSGAT